MADRERISLCIIARDEERNLPRCLASVYGAVDEIIVVDTGSTDATVAIARTAGARVYHALWTGDFAAARNTALEQATGDWVLVLDADDELPPETREAIPALIAGAEPHVNGFAFVVANWLGRKAGGHLSTVLHPRLWRNRPQHRYRGIIHEWINVDPLQYTGLRIYHWGYLQEPEAMRRKSARNIGLLEEVMRREPSSAFRCAQLAAEHSRIGRLPVAAAWYRKAWELERIHFIASGYSLVLLRLRRHSQALEILEEGLRLWPDFTDLYYRKGEALLATGDYGGARAALQRCLELGSPPPQYPSLEGHSTFLAWYHLAQAEAALHNWEAAARAAWQALTKRADYSPAVSVLVRSLVALLGPAEALELLNREVALTPGSTRLVARCFAERGCWRQALALLSSLEPAAADRLLQADCLLALGETRSAREVLETLNGQTNPAGRHVRNARLLVDWLEGDHAAGESLLKAARRYSARLNLGEKLLLLGRPDLAARLLAVTAEGKAPWLCAGAVGRLLARYGQAPKARPLLAEALAHWGRRRCSVPVTGGGRPELFQDLAQSCLADGIHSAAAEAFREALRLEPHRLVAWLGLAEVCLRAALPLLPRQEQHAAIRLVEAISDERHRPEPVYDRPGRSQEPAPCPAKPAWTDR